MKRLAVAILFVLSVFLVGANVANLQNDQERQPNNVSGLLAGMPLPLAAVSGTSVLLIENISKHDKEHFVTTDLVSGTADRVADAPNGVFRLSNTTINEGPTTQTTDNNGTKEGVAVPAAGAVIVFEARIRMDDVDDADWFIGLMENDTTPADGAGAVLANGADNHVGWHHVLADSGIPGLSTAGTALANIADVTQTAGTVGASGNLLVDSTYYRFGIRIEGTDKVQFFIDGSAVSAQATLGTALADGLVPTFFLIANGSAVTMDMDYVYVARTRTN